MSKEKEKGYERGGVVTPHIENEYSRLTKVLVTPTPELVTSFTDLKVNPIQAKAISEIDASQRFVVYDGAAECHANLLEILRANGVELVYSEVTPIKEGHTPLFTRDVGVIIEDVFIPSSMRFPYRQVEVAAALGHINP
jgi:N-dimethylarginine dimethylaminohydrolase